MFHVRVARLLPTLLGGRALHRTQGHPAARVAVVLSGCGVYDGSEIHEASAILVHLSRAGADVKIFAPDTSQMHVIDHSKGQPTQESRNVLVESARIARGDITALSSLNVQDHDAVIFPGGFGAAKNLSSFAVDGESCGINSDRTAQPGSRPVSMAQCPAWLPPRIKGALPSLAPLPCLRRTAEPGSLTVSEAHCPAWLPPCVHGAVPSLAPSSYERCTAQPGSLAVSETHC
ncbi:ES1 homolog, mitochondrial [Pelobates cultripes]|uniref:ES1 homolog, mitochondrial n=1 Tax=Pelobates cultripes TaxID=61616 RepID=A0AAD1VKT0_PELCU|nr:ES1 homolog, mitochondrial [Pelobates cultripes]